MNAEFQRIASRDEKAFLSDQCKEIEENNGMGKGLGKTTRPFRYDLNAIPYNYTVDATNRFEGLDLVDRVLEKLWMEAHNTV